MPIALLSGGNRITAARWNTLYEELDAKMTLTLGGITPFCTSNISDVKRLLGRCFFFISGTPRRIFYPAYDHTVFTNFLTGLDPVTDYALLDAGRKVASLAAAVPGATVSELGYSTAGFLDQSLQVHTVEFGSPAETHRIAEFGQARPEKVYRMGLAELVFEGAGFASYTFNAAWNKYGCFRVHNCNDYAMVVDFGGGYTLSIPKFSVRCARRVNGSWITGLNYFNRVVPGDPTVFSMPVDEFSSGTIGAKTPRHSMAVNNSMCPLQVGHEWVAELARFGRVQRLSRNPHSVYDVGALYSDYLTTT